jgi:opacity protein-like surface antigen
VHPYIGLGYSFYVFDISGVNPGLGIVEDGETLYGFSFNLGIQTDLSDRLFINIEYDFSRVDRNDLVPDTRYNKNINLIKLGAGFRF